MTQPPSADFIAAIMSAAAAEPVNNTASEAVAQADNLEQLQQDNVKLKAEIEAATQRSFTRHGDVLHAHRRAERAEAALHNVTREKMGVEKRAYIRSESYKTTISELKETLAQLQSAGSTQQAQALQDNEEGTYDAQEHAQKIVNDLEAKFELQKAQLNEEAKQLCDKRVAETEAKLSKQFESKTEMAVSQLQQTQRILENENKELKARLLSSEVLVAQLKETQQQAPRRNSATSPHIAQGPRIAAGIHAGFPIQREQDSAQVNEAFSKRRRLNSLSKANGPTPSRDDLTVSSTSTATFKGKTPDGSIGFERFPQPHLNTTQQAITSHQYTKTQAAPFSCSNESQSHVQTLPPHASSETLKFPEFLQQLNTNRLSQGFAVLNIEAAMSAYDAYIAHPNLLHPSMSMVGRGAPLKQQPGAVNNNLTYQTNIRTEPQASVPSISAPSEQDKSGISSTQRPLNSQKEATVLTPVLVNTQTLDSSNEQQVQPMPVLASTQNAVAPPFDNTDQTQKTPRQVEAGNLVVAPENQMSSQPAQEPTSSTATVPQEQSQNNDGSLVKLPSDGDLGEMDLGPFNIDDFLANDFAVDFSFDDPATNKEGALTASQDQTNNAASQMYTGFENQDNVSQQGSQRYTIDPALTLKDNSQNDALQQSEQHPPVDPALTLMDNFQTDAWQQSHQHSPIDPVYILKSYTPIVSNSQSSGHFSTFNQPTVPESTTSHVMSTSSSYASKYYFPTAPALPADVFPFPTAPALPAGAPPFPSAFVMPKRPSRYRRNTAAFPICLNCYRSWWNDTCDEGEPCKNCMGLGVPCERILCLNYQSGTCPNSRCTKVHEGEARYKQLVQKPKTVKRVGKKETKLESPVEILQRQTRERAAIEREAWKNPARNEEQEVIVLD